MTAARIRGAGGALMVVALAAGAAATGATGAPSDPPSRGQVVALARTADAALARVDALTARAESAPLRPAARPGPAERAATSGPAIRREIILARLAAWRAGNLERRLRGFPPRAGGPGPAARLRPTRAQVAAARALAQRAIRRAAALDPRIPRSNPGPQELAGGIVATRRGVVGPYREVDDNPPLRRVIVMHHPGIDQGREPYAAMIRGEQYYARGVLVGRVFFASVVSIEPADDPR